MLNNKHRMLKNVFIVCFSLFMIVLSIAPAFAEAEAIELSESNIAEYPTITGEAYFGQRIGDYLTISGGKVTTDGTETGEEIPGYFDFIDPDYAPDGVLPLTPASIKFVPEDENTYVGFEIEKSFDVQYTVVATPMYVDTSSEIPTADLAKAGLLLSAKINAVPVRNALTGDIIDGVKWAWSKPEMVKSNGFYQAKVSKTGYTTLTVDIFVRVAGDMTEPLVKKYPTVEPTTWHEGLKAGDLKFDGGEFTEPGHFEFSEPDKKLSAGNCPISFVFIPDDESKNPEYGTSRVDIAKADASFVDENGATTVPKLTWTLGTKYYMTNLFSQLEKMKANCGTFKVGAIAIDGIQLDGNIFVATEYKDDGYTATATLKSQENTNYTNTLKFKIVIEKNKINPDIQSQGNNMFAVVDRNIFSSATLTGRFTVEVQGEKGEYAQTITDVKLNVPFEYHPGKSGKYTFTITYDDSNDGKYELPEPVEVSKDIVLSWTVTGKNVHFDSRLANYGEEVMVDATITNDKFGGWKFYDESGKEIKDFNYTETSQNLRITFVMPDYPITVEAVDKTQSGISGGDDSDFFSSFLAWLNNLLARFRALMDAVAQLLQVVG